MLSSRHKASDSVNYADIVLVNTVINSASVLYMELAIDTPPGGFVLKITALVIAAVLSASAAMAAEGPPAPRGDAAPASVVKPATVTTKASQRITNKYVIMCYTCGGNYPHKARDVPLGGTNNVWEWGSGCGGSQTWRRDGNPYMCYH